MRSVLSTLLVSAALAVCLPACRTQREVISGPTNTGLDRTPSEGLGSTRFSNQDPYGYMGNKSQGLNAMSDKMFNGKLQEAGAKQLSTSRSFLTREFAGQKRFKEKQFAGAGKRSEWEDTLFETGSSRDETLQFRDSGRQARTFENDFGDRAARTGEFRDAGKIASTGEYYPAAKAASPDNSRPPIASQGGEGEKSRVKSLIESRGAEGGRVTIGDIRSLVGKQ